MSRNKARPSAAKVWPKGMPGNSLLLAPGGWLEQWQAALSGRPLQHQGLHCPRSSVTYTAENSRESVTGWQVLNPANRNFLHWRREVLNQNHTIISKVEALIKTRVCRGTWIQALSSILDWEARDESSAQNWTPKWLFWVRPAWECASDARLTVPISQWKTRRQEQDCPRALSASATWHC